jgi:ribonuclease HII
MAARGGREGRGRVSDPFRFDRGLLASALEDGPVADLRVAGADEAGRGCLAGPLVAAAVVLDYSAASFPGLERLTDSKQLSPQAREGLFPIVLSLAARVSWVAVSPLSIDQIGLHRCNMAALGRAIESLRGEYRLAVVDGFDLRRPELRSQGLVGGDYKSAAVAAASVVAKVVRDRLMRSLAPDYPGYGFEEHVGYGTERHREALRRRGPCALHRLSFQGVAEPQLGLWDE